MSSIKIHATASFLMNVTLINPNLKEAYYAFSLYFLSFSVSHQSTTTGSSSLPHLPHQYSCLSFRDSVSSSHRRVIHLHNFFLAASLASENRFSTAAPLLLVVRGQACASWPMRADGCVFWASKAKICLLWFYFVYYSAAPIKYLISELALFSTALIINCWSQACVLTTK